MFSIESSNVYTRTTFDDSGNPSMNDRMWGGKPHRLKKSSTWDACTWDSGLGNTLPAVTCEELSQEVDLPSLMKFLELDNEKPSPLKKLTRRSTFGAVSNEHDTQFLGDQRYGDVRTSIILGEVENSNPNVEVTGGKLHRANSAELVRKAFPEMLFDRTSPHPCIETEFGFPEEEEEGEGESSDDEQHYSQYQPYPAFQPQPQVGMYEMQQNMQFMYYMQQMMFAQQQGMSPPPNFQQPSSTLNSQSAPWSPPVQQQTPPVCSNLLAEHKRTGRRPSAQQLIGHVLEFSKDPHGSRYLQEITAAASPREKEMLVSEIMSDCLNVIQDLFGNYVMQNFLDHATDAQRDTIASKMIGVVTTLSMHPHGCRVVQRLLDLVGPQTRFKLLDELVLNQENLEVAAKDPHATHVLQKAVTVLHRDLFPHIEARKGRAEMFSKKKANHSKSKQYQPSRDAEILATSRVLLKAVEDVVAANVMILATNQHACRLVQRVLGDCDTFRSPCVIVMIAALEGDYDNLSVDQHGNFIMQHILDMGQQNQADRVLEFVSTRVIELSQHKFGSHLVEKCIITASPTQAQSFIGDLLSANYNTLTKMMKDPYANFVLQRAYDVANRELAQRFEYEVSRRSEVLSQFTHGRHIIAHLSKQRN